MRFKVMLFRYIFCVILSFNIAFAYKCYESYCAHFGIGSGVAYANFKAGGMPDFNNIGGYLSAFANYYSKRLAFNYDLQVGLFNVAQSGYIQGLNNINSQDRMGGFVLMDLNAGLNLGSLDKPILLTLSLPVNMYNLGWNVAQRLSSEAIFLGFNLYSNTKLTERLRLSYQLGYSYCVSGRYRIDSYANIATLKGGHRLLFNLNLLYKRENAESSFTNKDKADFYASLKGIYYMLEPSNTIHINNTPLHYNASNNLMLTLEFGVSFGIPPMSSKDFTRKSPY